jgi:regulator of cell morphogenesis and NO signaling
MVALTESILKSDAVLADVARTLPQTIAVFEEAGIDYSCKGARPLHEAAGSAGFTADELLSMLNAAPPSGERDWSEAPLAALMTMLLQEHRDTILDALREVRQAIDAIQTTVRMAEARRLAVLASDFTTHVLAHITSEEQQLFPAIAQLDSMSHGERNVPAPPRISQRILREMIEHEELRDRLRTMRELACRLPDIATGVTHLRAALRQFSRVVHHHIHLENNVLYPQAIEAENTLRRMASAEMPVR